MMKKEKVVILGAGLTGISVARYFDGNCSKYNLIVIDSRVSLNISSLKEQLPNVSFHLGAFGDYEEEILTSDFVVVSPGISLNHKVFELMRDKGIKILSDIEIFCSEVDSKGGKIIAITGSNGKSTVTKICGDLLKAHDSRVSIGGNYGRPALELLEDDSDVFVLELSSFQLDLLTKVRFHAGIVLNVTPDHLDRYDSYEAYKNSKYSIYNHCERKVFASDDVLKTENAIYYQCCHDGGSEYVKERKGVFSIEGSDTDAIARVTNISLSGEHNKNNLLAALALTSTYCELKPSRIQDAIDNYKGLPHRCELVSHFNDKSWINDSKGTNVASSIAAINLAGSATKGNISVILGGQTKGADITELANMVTKHCTFAVLIGESKEEFERKLQGNIPYAKARDMQEAVDIADTHTVGGDCILLSPGCASFDMFDNYEHRGKAFVKELKIKEG